MKDWTAACHKSDENGMSLDMDFKSMKNVQDRA